MLRVLVIRINSSDSDNINKYNNIWFQRANNIVDLKKDSNKNNSQWVTDRRRTSQRLTINI